jgi:hypothetical protein
MARVPREIPSPAIPFDELFARTTLAVEWTRRPTYAVVPQSGHRATSLGGGVHRRPPAPRRSRRTPTLEPRTARMRRSPPVCRFARSAGPAAAASASNGSCEPVEIWPGATTFTVIPHEAIKVLASRAHQKLIWTRTRHTNALRSALREDYPPPWWPSRTLPTATPWGCSIGPHLSLTATQTALKRGGRQRNIAGLASEIRAALRSQQLAAPRRSAPRSRPPPAPPSASSPS